MAYVIYNRKGVKMNHYDRFDTIQAAEKFLRWWFSGMVPEMTIREETQPNIRLYL